MKRFLFSVGTFAYQKHASNVDQVRWLHPGVNKKRMLEREHFWAVRRVSTTLRQRLFFCAAPFEPKHVT